MMTNLKILLRKLNGSSVFIDYRGKQVACNFGSQMNTLVMQAHIWSKHLIEETEKLIHSKQVEENCHHSTFHVGSHFEFIWLFYRTLWTMICLFYFLCAGHFFSSLTRYYISRTLWTIMIVWYDLAASTWASKCRLLWWSISIIVG